MSEEITVSEAIDVLMDISDKYTTKQAVALVMAFRALAHESKIGYWIVQPSNKEQGERDFIWWKCSKCGQVIYSETEQDRREFHAFCGRCGARMEESEG